MGGEAELDDVAAWFATYPVSVVERSLQCVGKDRRLTLSRDSSCFDIAASYLRVLMKYVEFRAPSLPIGVSGLTRAILKTGDVKLLRAALERGLIPAEEPIERLFELAGQNAAARMLLLTCRRPSAACGPSGTEDVCSRALTDDERAQLLDDPALRAMASSETLSFCNSLSANVLSANGMETQDHMAAYALRGETDTVLRCAALKEGGTERARLTQVWPSDKLCGRQTITLLCCAALAGRTETVRALLDAGFDPEERDMGRPGTFNTTEFLHGGTIMRTEQLALSPLLCALLWERWETAALLLERGAACGLASYTVRRAFEALHGGNVPYEDIARELGEYLEGEWLGKK